MTDDEMRAMPIPTLQDEGLLFLWVTGRAMEVGRECMRHWGYTRVDEVVWVKTNQVNAFVKPLFRSLVYSTAASARHPYRPYGPLVESHQRTYARRCQDEFG